ncbi:MAG: WRKY and zinc finger domain-containing protein [Trebouxia sp. A1-2]|nr:MAG: WRKY and zinc finger domain-containing protein [Trebouxia sp. A1-2]
MSTVHELGESSAPTDPTIGQPRPSTLFDGEVPVVHSVSRFGRQTTRIPRPSHLNTATIDAPTQQPSAPEQSPVMVYSRVEPSPTTGMPYPPPLFQTQGTNTEQAASFAAGAARPWSGAGRGATPATRKEDRGSRRESCANDDGYHWRKYGEKTVKGSPYPRSYYKCSHAGCNVKKIVERDPKTGDVSSSIAKGGHNHTKPNSRPSSGSMNTRGTGRTARGGRATRGRTGRGRGRGRGELEREPSFSFDLNGPYSLQTRLDMEAIGDTEDGMATEDDEDDTDLPPAEMHAEPASTAEAAQHAAQAAAAVRQAELRERTRLEEDAIARLVAMREEKVENMAQEVSPASAKRQRRASGAGSPSPYSTPPASVGPTMSDDMYMLMDEEEKTSVSMSGGRSGGRADRELLRVVTEGDTYDDGYRWRKYGQKVVKGNPHPRSYYKCTASGCFVRKHVEMSGDEANQLVTTYEGMHNHPIPPATSGASRGAMGRRSSLSGADGQARGIISTRRQAAAEAERRRGEDAEDVSSAHMADPLSQGQHQMAPTFVGDSIHQTDDEKASEAMTGGSLLGGPGMTEMPGLQAALAAASAAMQAASQAMPPPGPISHQQDPTLSQAPVSVGDRYNGTLDMSYDSNQASRGWDSSSLVNAPVSSAMSLEHATLVQQSLPDNHNRAVEN